MECLHFIFSPFFPITIVLQVSYLAADSLFPEWKIWTQFLDETTMGLRLDALAESHPIEVIFFFLCQLPIFLMQLKSLGQLTLLIYFYIIKNKWKMVILDFLTLCLVGVMRGRMDGVRKMDGLYLLFGSKSFRDDGWKEGIAKPPSSTSLHFFKLGGCK